MATEKRLIDANEYPCKDCGKTYCHQNCEKFIAWLGNAVEAVEVVHGRWIPQKYSDPEGDYYLFHCSECCVPNARERNYCPNCGAKMDGDGNG